MIIKELCIGSIQDVKNKFDKLNSVNRFETCSRLDVGGLTPDFATFQYIKENTNIDQVVMIRNKDTFYIEDENDINVMVKSIEDFAKLGAKNFIFGYLTKDNEIDLVNIKKLVNKVKTIENATYSFHMAIDLVNDYSKSINELIDLGFKRILLKGGKNQALDNIENLSNLQNKFGDKIQLLVGGKVNKDNYLKVIELTNIKQVHGREIV